MPGLSLRTLLKGADRAQVDSAHACWCEGEPPTQQRDVVGEIARAMSDGEAVQQRRGGLPAKLSDLLDGFLREVGGVRALSEITVAGSGSWPSRYDVEAAVAALHREGFVFPLAMPRSGTGMAEHFAAPVELVNCISEQRRQQENAVRSTITLKGFLNARYFDRKQRDGDPDARADDHARKVYKIYLMESSLRGRIRSLPDSVRQVWDIALSRFGGLMPVDEIASALESEDCPDIDFIKKCLEEAMLGTVAPLPLARFGIQPCTSAIVVFYEVALIELQEHSRKHPAQVDDVITCGVDVISNVGRFLREVGASKVQFTVEGRLYKASENRIMKSLLPVAGGFLDAQAQIRLIYRYCLSRRLLDRSGERALRATDAGREFDQLPLVEKAGAMLAYCVEERGLPGEDYHHVRMRRFLLRLLRRVEPEQWHELLFIPFLARNSYLGRLEEAKVEELFATRFKVGGYLPTENLQQICWNLGLFIKKRLFPLGLVDLGMRGGRPVAVRLSRLGAELLGAVPAGELGGERSEVIVNPDFEVILFPGEDEHEVVHSFDRFAERSKSDRIHHFRLTRGSVQAALKDGLSVAQVLQELTDRSRAPLPQNVRYTLEDWADQAGVLVLEGDELHGRRPEQIDRFLALAKVKPFVKERTSATTVALRDPAALDSLQEMVRDLGFLIEKRAT